MVNFSFYVAVHKQIYHLCNICFHRRSPDFLLVLSVTFGMDISLQWRNNGHDGVSNHQPHDCLLKRLFKRKCQSSASLAFVRGIHEWPVNSTHKRPVTRKMFPFDDIIMLSHLLFSSSNWTQIKSYSRLRCSLSFTSVWYFCMARRRFISFSLINLSNLDVRSFIWWKIRNKALGWVHFS